MNAVAIAVMLLGTVQAETECLSNAALAPEVRGIEDASAVCRIAEAAFACEQPVSEALKLLTEGAEAHRDTRWETERLHSEAAKLIQSLPKKHTTQEAALALHAHFFKPARFKPVQSAFTEVKRTLIEMIQSSRRLTEDDKRLLLTQLTPVQLATLPEDFDSLGQFYGKMGSNEFDIEIAVKPRILFSASWLARSSKIPRRTLLRLLAHELAHFINPCDAPEVYRQVLAGHPETPRKFSMAVPAITAWAACVFDANDKLDRPKATRLPSPRTIRELCKSLARYESKANPGPALKECLEEKESEQKTLGLCVRNPGGGNQIDEVFADFMASEVSAALLKKEKLSPQKRTKLAREEADDWARLFIAKKSDLHLSMHHPSGLYRTEILPFFSSSFTDLLNCEGAPVKPCQSPFNP